MVCGGGVQASSRSGALGGPALAGMLAAGALVPQASLPQQPPRPAAAMSQLNEAITQLRQGRVDGCGALSVMSFCATGTSGCTCHVDGAPASPLCDGAVWLMQGGPDYQGHWPRWSRISALKARVQPD